MAVDRHDWGALGICWAAGAAWRIAAVGAEGGLHYSAGEQW
jgi:dienelactone hydrolase